MMTEPASTGGTAVGTGRWHTDVQCRLRCGLSGTGRPTGLTPAKLPKARPKKCQILE